jgi:carboxyl-terminal processing protease
MSGRRKVDEYRKPRLYNKEDDLLKKTWFNLQGPIWFALFSFLAVLLIRDHADVRAVQEKDKTYEKLQIFTDVLERLKQSYVEEVDSEKLIYGAIEGMLQTLDPHSNFLPPDVYKELQVETKGSFGGLGIEITIRDGLLTIVSPIEDTPAFRAGLQAGDKILQIDGKPTKDMSLFEAVKKMRGEKGTEITLTILRDGVPEPKDYKLTRDVIKLQSVKYKLMDQYYGYIRITQFQENTDRELTKALKSLIKESDGKLRGLILDLRNNPGGLLDQAIQVADMFIDSGKIVYTDGRVPSAKMEFFAHPQAEKYPYSMIVLVNGGSASASEIVAGALQDHHRALILGTQTFGKGSVQTIIPLDDGSGLKLTTAHYFTPSGRVIQAEGIKPDIEVPNLIPMENGKPIRFLREKDLERHLGGNTNGQKDEEKSEQGKGEQDSEESAEEGHEGVPDTQLDRALDMLKSWEIFQKQNHEASAAMAIGAGS